MRADEATTAIDNFVDGAARFFEIIELQPEKVPNHDVGAVALHNLLQEILLDYDLARAAHVFISLLDQDVTHLLFVLLRDALDQ